MKSAISHSYFCF